MIIRTFSRSTMAIVACALLPFVVPQRASALTFSPSEQEWLMWPDYCRARYVVSGSGMGSEFENRVPPAEVERYKAELGEDAWYWLHHYCAALVYLKRATEATDEAKTEYWLKEAEVNILGQYRRITRDNRMFPDVCVGIARLYRVSGDTEKAMRYLQEAMAAQPAASSPYALASIISREAGDSEQALSILLRGNTALDGKSAELHYFLGHIYIDLNDLDSAAEHARQAYELGYPLPGLAAKLHRLGHDVELQRK